MSIFCKLIFIFKLKSYFYSYWNCFKEWRFFVSEYFLCGCFTSLFSVFEITSFTCIWVSMTSISLHASVRLICMPNSLIWSLCFDFSQYQHETTYSDLVWRLAFLILAFKLLFLHCMKLLTLLFRVCIVHVRFTVMSISINCKINDIYFTVTYKIITYVDTSYEKQYHWPPVVNVPVLKVFIGAVSWAFLLSYILYHLITLKSISGHYYQNNKHEVLVLKDSSK